MFGFGKGKIEIQLSKFNFSPGEVIQGRVILKLNKPVRARGVNVRIVGERKTSSRAPLYSNNPSARRSSTNVDYVLDFKQPLDREKEYPASEIAYDFQIKIPENVLTQPKIGNDTISTLVKSAQILSGVNSSIRWYLIANIDIPGGFDVSKKVQINVA